MCTVKRRTVVLVLTLGVMAALRCGAFVAMAEEEDCGLVAGDPAFIVPDGRDIASVAESEPTGGAPSGLLPRRHALPCDERLSSGAVCLDEALEAPLRPILASFGVLAVATGVLMLTSRKQPKS